MIPLKESLEMFYNLRVALKRRCKDAFLVKSCQLHCKDNYVFLFFLSQINNECFNLQQTTQSL